MYELVNTSLPNGLMPGTHGFATVAMTKGLPDAIRGGVEMCCAYPHRTSAHDATYYSENPVNFFHLVVSGGFHAVGRTAPCDFDYTGRTNRLARVFVLNRNEMPGAGAVALIDAARRELAAPWQGEAHYLAPDGEWPARLRALRKRADGAPTWAACFGAEGARYCRGIAALVAQNVSSGVARSVYFKASVAEDADGERLLALFGEVIAALPDDLAAQVTFSTFAPCVPGGMTCHLRGVFDRDAAMEAISALQPWVDLTTGRVVHAEMLPAAVVPAPAEGVSRTSVPADSPQSRRSSRSQTFGPAGGSRSNASEGGDRILWIVGAGLAVVVIALAVFLFRPFGTTAGKSSFEESDPDPVRSLEPTLSDEEKKLAAALKASNATRDETNSVPKEKSAPATNCVKRTKAESDEKASQASQDDELAKMKRENEAKKQEQARVEQENRRQRERSAAERRARLTVPLTEIPREELCAYGDLKGAIPQSERAQLTNECDLVFYFERDGKVVCEGSCCRASKSESSTKRDVTKNKNNRRKNDGGASVYSVKEPDVPRGARWIAVRAYYPSGNTKLFWIWRGKSTFLWENGKGMTYYWKMFFADEKTRDWGMGAKCANCVFEVKAEVRGVEVTWYCEKSEQRIDTLCGKIEKALTDGRDAGEAQNSITDDELKKKLKGFKDQIDRALEVSNVVEHSFAELEKAKGEKEALESNRRDKDYKERKDSINKKIEGINNTLKKKCADVSVTFIPNTIQKDIRNEILRKIGLEVERLKKIYRDNLPPDQRTPEESGRGKSSKGLHKMKVSVRVVPRDQAKNAYDTPKKSGGAPKEGGN